MRIRYTRVTIPEHCHPLVKALFTEMQEQQCSVLDMAERSGVNKNTLKDWRNRSNPRVHDLEACLNVLGKTLTVSSVKGS